MNNHRYQANIYLSPSQQNLEDAIALEPRLGDEEVRKALLRTPWIHEYLAEWAPLANEGFIDAHSALARTIAVAGVIGSANVDDLSYALVLPRWFMCVVVTILETANWRRSFFPRLVQTSRETTENTNSFINLVEELLEDHMPSTIHYVDLLSALGSEVLGLGQEICTSRSC